MSFGKVKVPRAGFVDWPALLGLFLLRDHNSSPRVRGTGSRSNPRAPKRYDGWMLRTLRAERGVGRPPHKRRSTGAADA